MFIIQGSDSKVPGGEHDARTDHKRTREADLRENRKASKA